METPPSTPPTKPIVSKRSYADAEPRRSTDSAISDSPLLSSSAAAPPGIKSFLGEYTISSSTPPLGTGLWSTVYLAHPTPASPSSGLATPPRTPSRTITSSRTTSPAQLYAIKTPTSTSARAVLESEARILTHLSSRPGAEEHIVRFHGLDPRNGALVLGAAPKTLESFVQEELNALNENDRNERLVAIFPRLAARLVRALEWLHAQGVVHGDVKGGNILLEEEDGEVVPRVADFSSALFSNSTITQSLSAGRGAAAAGGGTWDFLSPTLLLHPQSSPTPRTDIHSLCITLLYVIFGSSPFDAVGANVFLRREMVKQNLALRAGKSDAIGERRLRVLERGTGWDVERWVESGLGGGEMKILEWRGEVEGVVRKMDGQR